VSTIGSIHSLIRSIGDHCSWFLVLCAVPFSKPVFLFYASPLNPSSPPLRSRRAAVSDTAGMFLFCHPVTRPNSIGSKYFWLEDMNRYYRNKYKRKVDQEDDDFRHNFLPNKNCLVDPALAIIEWRRRTTRRRRNEWNSCYTARLGHLASILSGSDGDFTLRERRTTRRRLMNYSITWSPEFPYQNLRILNTGCNTCGEIEEAG